MLSVCRLAYELEELLAEAALVYALLGVELDDELLLEVLRVLHDNNLQLHQGVLNNVIPSHLNKKRQYN